MPDLARVLQGPESRKHKFGNGYQLSEKFSYPTMSLKAVPRGFTTYGTSCFWHKDFTSGAILYRLWRGMVGNRLQ